MLGELAEAQVEGILQEGLHEFLTRFIHQNARPRPGRGRRLPLRGPVMRLSVRHGTVYQFDAPMRFVTQSHRLTPVSNGGQRVRVVVGRGRGRGLRRGLHRRRRRRGQHHDRAGAGDADRGARRGGGRDHRHRRRPARPPRGDRSRSSTCGRRAFTKPNRLLVELRDAALAGRRRGLARPRAPAVGGGLGGDRLHARRDRGRHDRRRGARARQGRLPGHDPRADRARPRGGDAGALRDRLPPHRGRGGRGGARLGRDPRRRPRLDRLRPGQPLLPGRALHPPRLRPRRPRGGADPRGLARRRRERRWT